MARVVTSGLAVFVVWRGTRLSLDPKDHTVRNLIVAADLVVAAFGLIFAF
jgi:hypothetical protein